MKQRVPRKTWYLPAGTNRRPRLLIEDDHPALEVSDFTAFRDAGFDVAFCSGPGRSGPGRTRGACPLLSGADCEVLAGADVVLHGIDPAAGVAADIRWWHPELPVVVKTDGQAPAGCAAIPACCSVKGQVEAVRRILGSAGDQGSTAISPPSR